MSVPYVSEGQLLVESSKLKSSINEYLPLFNSFEKISDYLYEVEFIKIDYNYALEYFKNEDKPFVPFACSSIRKGNFYGRNLDWYYHEDVDFIVRVPSIDGRHSSIGVGNLSGLDKKFVSSRAYSDRYKALPFHLVDGINDAGLICSINVVPRERGITTKTVPLEEERIELTTTMLPRYILDNYSTATEAVEDIEKHVSILCSPRLNNFDYDIHYMIADANKTYVMEIINNEIKYFEHNIMTNFHLYGVNFNSNGSVYTPETQTETKNAVITNNITPHGSGLERYNVLNSKMSTITSLEKMMSVMHNDLNYKNAYTLNTHKWYTEFVGNYGNGLVYDCNTPKSKFENDIIPLANATIMEYSKYLFDNRDRVNKPTDTWHTTHTSVYDLINKKLYVYDATESDTPLEFNFKKYYTAAEIDALLKSILNNNLGE